MIIKQSETYVPPVLSQDNRGFLRKGFDRLLRNPVNDVLNSRQLRSSYLEPENINLRVLADPSKTPLSDKLKTNHPYYKWLTNLGGDPEGTVVGGAIRGALDPKYPSETPLGPRDRFLGAMSIPLAARAAPVASKVLMNPYVQGAFTVNAIAQAPGNLTTAITGDTLKERATGGLSLLSDAALARMGLNGLGASKYLAKYPRAASSLQRFGFKGQLGTLATKNPIANMAVTAPAYYGAIKPTVKPSRFGDASGEDFNAWQDSQSENPDWTEVWKNTEGKPVPENQNTPIGWSPYASALGAGVGMPLIYSLMTQPQEPGPNASQDEIDAYEDQMRRKRRIQLMLALTGAGAGYLGSKYLKTK